MNKRIILAFFFAPILLWSSAKESLDSESNQPVQTVTETRELTCLSPIQLTLSHVFGRGVGHKGYSSAELFFIQSKIKQFYPYLDTRLHVMNHGKIALNAGGGARVLLEQYPLALGGNIYYDYRKSSHLNTSQLAGGFELLSPYVDFRLNGYLPLGGTKHSSPLTFVAFEENHINVKRKTSYAFPSLNAEVGMPILWPFPKVIQLYTAIGPYYLFGSRVSENHYSSSWGVKYRLTASIFQYCELGFELNHDSIFDTTYQGFIAFHFPLYKKNACRSKRGIRANDYSQKVLRPPVRNEIIPVKNQSEIYTLKDANGSPIQVYFINNAASCPGLGTFESPFCTFLNAQSGVPSGPVLVYVLEGNSLTTPYNTNAYVMQADQILQGSSTPITLNGVTIPPMTSGMPILTNPGGRGVDLANRTTIRGLNFQNTSGTSIYGNSLLGPITLDQNTILNSGGHGIEITNHTGNVIVSNNTISTTNNNGISLDHATAPGTAWIFGNTILNATQSGVLIRLAHPEAFGWIANNYFSRNILPDGAGFDIATEVTEGALLIESNTMESNTQNNIHALDGLHIIRNNTVTTLSPISQVPISYNCTGAGLSSREAYILDNDVTVTAANVPGVRVTNAGTNANFYAEIEGNTVQTLDPTKGIRVDVPNPGTACVSITGNQAATFQLDGTSGPVNVQQTQIQYQTENQASTGFAESGTVNFGSSCTAP